MIRCLIVDDEPLALDIMENYVKKITEFELAGRCSSALEALDKINNGEIDLVFLDIQMSEITGIQLLKSLTKSPMVIFTTAYHEYALQGYDLNVLDYLLKPIPFDRFLKASNKAIEYYQYTQASFVEKEEKEYIHDFIFVKSEHQMIKINFSDILYIEGLKDYVKIVLQQGKPILSLQNLKAIESKLPSHKFKRIHKSYIVSIEKIDLVHKGKIKISDKEIPLGDNFRDDFMKYIEQ